MNLMEAFFLGWAFFIGSFCVTIVFFEYTCPNKYKMIKDLINECDSESESDSESELFENSGKDEVKQLKTRKLSGDDLEFISNQYVEVETPQGEIVLKYNVNEKGFIYYANFNVQYKLLDAVARQFVLKFDCKELYHSIDFDAVSDISDNDSPEQILDDYSDSDTLEELNDEPDEDEDEEGEDEDEEDEDEEGEDEDEDEDEDEEDEEGEEDEDEDKHNIFANLKNYKKDELNKDDNGKIIEEKKINKFLYKGKINEFRKKESNMNKTTKELSYKDFKDKKKD